jgi:hypothetical protein
MSFVGMAAAYQPLPPNASAPAGHRGEDLGQFAVECAKALAPYQSPTFKAIAVMAPPPPTPVAPEREDIDLNDPVAIARVYQRRIQAVRG